MRPDWKVSLMRRLAGGLWCSAWILALVVFVGPWTELGGIVSERMRWLLRLVLGVALIAGLGVGDWARQAAHPGSGRCHATLLRLALYPPALATALALCGLALRGAGFAIGVVATGFLAYWAGFDGGIGGLPLLRGRPYSFRGPILPDAHDADPGIAGPPE
jgi:hypothetical protein